MRSRSPKSATSATKQVIERLFAGDLKALVQHLGKIAAHHRQARDIRVSELSDALVEVTACLPVYRTYIHNGGVSESDRGYIEGAIETGPATHVAPNG